MCLALLQKEEEGKRRSGRQGEYIIFLDLGKKTYGYDYANEMFYCRNNEKHFQLTQDAKKDKKDDEDKLMENEEDADAAAAAKPATEYLGKLQ